jgi:DNA-binding protein HU-beta
MNKTNLIDVVAQATGMKKAQADAAVNAAIAAIADALAAGEKVQIAGFGSFEVKERAARDGKNPRTGEKIQIAASKTAAFSASKSLKDRLNG